MIIMKVGRYLFGTSLFIAFIGIFGLKALKRYLDHAVIVHTSKDNYEPLLDGPAITICAEPDTIMKQSDIKTKKPVSIKEGVRNICNITGKSNEVTHLQDCFKTLFLNTSEMIESVLWNMTETENKWTETISQFNYGKCQTLQNYEKLGNQQDLNALHIRLNPKHRYTFYLHDPEFFFLNLNPMTIPKVKNKIALTGKRMVFLFQHLSATEHRLIHRDNFRCNEDRNYKLSDCIRKHVLRTAGCSTSFESFAFDVDGCESQQKILAYFKEYNVLETVNMNTIAKESQCLTPCNYIEYSVAGEELYKFDKVETNITELMIGVNYASTQLTIKEELFVYPIESFVAEIGGALGMFLGFDKP